MNNPTGPRDAYADALAQAADDLGDAISHIVAEQDSGRISPLQACLERVGLLEAHLERLKRLRAEHLGE
jgi:hypothetical protein